LQTYIFDLVIRITSISFIYIYFILFYIYALRHKETLTVLQNKERKICRLNNLKIIYLQTRVSM